MNETSRLLPPNQLAEAAPMKDDEEDDGNGIGIGYYMRASVSSNKTPSLFRTATAIALSLIVGSMLLFLMSPQQNQTTNSLEDDSDMRRQQQQQQHQKGAHTTLLDDPQLFLLWQEWKQQPTSRTTEWMVLQQHKNTKKSHHSNKKHNAQTFCCESSSFWERVQCQSHEVSNRIHSWWRRAFVTEQAEENGVSVDSSAAAYLSSNDLWELSRDKLETVARDVGQAVKSSSDRVNDKLHDPDFQNSVKQHEQEASDWVHQQSSHVKEASQNAGKWLEDERNNIQETAPKVANTIKSTAQQSTQVIEHSWNTLTQQMHNVWESVAHPDNNDRWWQRTVDSEQAWKETVMNNLNRFHQRLQDWWADSPEKVEEKFQSYWHRANDTEKEWWRNTVHAYHKFQKAAGKKTDLWWDLTKQAAQNNLKSIKEKGNTAVNWTTQEARDDYEWSKQKLSGEWARANEKAEKEWNTTRHVVSATEALWWNATRLWFENHYAGREEPSASFLEGPLLYLNNSIALQMMVNEYGWVDQSSHFFALQRGLDVQANLAYCGVASASAVLNSLPNIELPVDNTFDPYPYATQESILNNTCVDTTVIHYNHDFNGILNVPGGLTMSQLAQLLKCHLPNKSWKVKFREVDQETSLEHVRTELVRAIMDPSARVIVNFDRSTLGQDGYSHFSPLGSYSRSKDAFLVMDVAKYKYPPVWVPTPRLFAAMRTVDTCGSWNYPDGQIDLKSRYLYPTEHHDLQKALKILSCRESHRGYIIVEPAQTSE